MVTDHFSEPVTPILTFWIRGIAVPFFCILFAATKMSKEVHISHDISARTHTSRPHATTLKSDQ